MMSSEDGQRVFHDEDTFTSGEMMSCQTFTSLRIIHTRERDVIDSIGDQEYNLPHFYTPQKSLMKKELVKTEWESPDQGYPPTPESVNIFMPEWMRAKKTADDILDAGPVLFNKQDSVPSRQYECDNNGPVASMVIHKNSQHYNMNHKNRGKCIVFNHEIFDTGFENRTGSTHDAEKIENTFRNLGFSIEIYNNLKHSEVMEKISQLSTENHEDSDCICVFVLTHGLAPDMIFAKDVAYKADNIWKPFTADKCRSLAGKPKLFFFQACRGNELDAGVTLQRNIAVNSETDTSISFYKIPTHADFLIAHSTTRGFYSWRNPKTGTWFVQCLCDVLDEYHKTTDLLKMLTICSRKVATDYASNNDINPTKHDQKQVPSITTMLIRDLYFFSK